MQDIELVNQLANSPDLIVLCLEFFASLQSLMYERIYKNLDELIENVKNKFDNYDLDTLNGVFLTLSVLSSGKMKEETNTKFSHGQRSVYDCVKDKRRKQIQNCHMDKDERR